MYSLLLCCLLTIYSVFATPGVDSTTSGHLQNITCVYGWNTTGVITYQACNDFAVADNLTTSYVLCTNLGVLLPLSKTVGPLGLNECASVSLNGTVGIIETTPVICSLILKSSENVTLDEEVFNCTTISHNVTSTPAPTPASNTTATPTPSPGSTPAPTPPPGPTPAPTPGSTPAPTPAPTTASDNNLYYIIGGVLLFVIVGGGCALLSLLSFMNRGEQKQQQGYAGYPPPYGGYPPPMYPPPQQNPGTVVMSLDGPIKNTSSTKYGIPSSKKDK